MASSSERTPLLSGENRSISEPLLTASPELMEAQLPTGSQSSGFLPKDASEAHNIMYERFSRKEKEVIVSIVSLIGVIPLFVSGSFFPSIPDIAKDLNTTPDIVNLAVSAGVFATATGAFIGASFSSYYGRRPVYLCGLPFLIVGSMYVATSRSIEGLIAWRFFQTFGVSFGLSVGAAVIGDIYRLEERGTAMGIFFAACLMGPALAPVVGGFAAQHASWRVMQACLGLAGVVGLIFVTLFLPETSFPGTRGIDKRRAELGGNNIPFTIPNPLASLALLRSPNLVATSIVGWSLLTTHFVILLSLPNQIAKRYGIETQASIGLLYFPLGFGNLAGAPLAGWLSDRVLRRMLKKRGGVWCPEDRLRPALLAAAVFVPLSALGVGISTRYVPGVLGLGLSVIFLFFNGFGVDMALCPSSAYVVDIMHSRSAESVAANNGLRALLISITVTAIAPTINRVGFMWTNVISASIAWTGFGLLCLVVKYGETMRNWVDVGYSTAENN